MLKRLSAILLTAWMLTAFLPAAATAETIVVYDAAQLSVFQRTRQDVAEHYNAAIRKGGAYDDADKSAWYTRAPSLEAPYDPGAVRQSTLDAMVAMTDFWRWLAGVEPLERGSSGSDELQRGALIRNWDFNHTVDDGKKPADMPQALWDSGKVRHDILAYNYTPRGSIMGWCNEGYDTGKGTWDTVGHRYCLIGAGVSALSFGYSGRVSIGIMEGNTNRMTAPFSAFPAPGPAPTELFSARKCAWSVEPNERVLRVSDPAALRVTVKDAAGGSYVCTQANGKLKYATSIREIDFVQPVTDGASYPDGSAFDVVITGLTEVASGKPAELRYRVEFFSMRNDMETTVTSCAPAQWSTLHIPASMNDAASLQMLSALLPDTVVASTESGRRVELPILDSWTPDPEHKCWTAAADASALPQTVTDPKGLLSRVTVSYEVEEYTGRFTAAGVTEAHMQFTVLRYMLGTPFVSLYQLRNSAVGWTSQLRYDEHSGNCSDDTYSAVFTMDAWQLSDQGVWVGVYASGRGGWVAGAVEFTSDCPHSQTRHSRTEPTCTEPGAEELYCAVCGELLSRTPLAPRGHDWTESSYVWGEYNASVTASRTCRNDKSHIQTETADIVARVTKQATQDEEGEVVYTARFSNEAFTEQTLTLVIPKLQPGGQPKLPCDGGAGCPGLVFSDMPAKGNWAHDAIDWAIVSGVTSGTSANAFAPGGSCTRAQVVTFLWRAMGSHTPQTAVNPFVDVRSGGYYYDAVLWAVENDVTSGTGASSFTPGGSCTRAQVVTFLWRAAGSPAPQRTDNPFVDVKSSSYYAAAVLWAVGRGITNGTDATHFSPGKGCTRAQVVTFLYRSCGAN